MRRTRTRRTRRTAGKEKGRAAGGGGSTLQGLDRILAYLGQCQPTAEEIEDGQRGWVAAQSAPAPTLLPDLKFHDLVFGHDLGSGSFSTVRYARQILKQTPKSAAGGPGGGGSGSTAGRHKGRSVWPEFAVKVISSTKIAEFGYEQNVIREIAILKTLSHPVSTLKAASAEVRSLWGALITCADCCCC